LDLHGGTQLLQQTDRMIDARASRAAWRMRQLRGPPPADRHEQAFQLSWRQAVTELRDQMSKERGIGLGGGRPEFGGRAVGSGGLSYASALPPLFHELVPFERSELGAHGIVGHAEGRGHLVHGQLVSPEQGHELAAGGLKEAFAPGWHGLASGLSQQNT